MDLGRKRGGTADHLEPRAPAAAALEAVLLVAFPEPAVLAVPADGSSVGRDWLSDAGIADPEISAAHLRFARAAGMQLLEDMGSRNGTWLGGVMLAPHEKVALEDGMVLRAGRTIAVYREGLLGPRAPAPPIGALVGPFGLRRVASRIEALRRHPPATVLLEGETGTGKELAAQAIAAALGRAEPYTAVNVAGVASGVFESQLFGHLAGAYSGAAQASKGIVQAHATGTVFLDEIGELPLELQPKLLRLLENREVLPVGAERPLPVDVTLIAATNRSLEALVEQGRFRHDLLARLAVTRLRLPALRERAEDVWAVARAVAPAVGSALASAHVEVEAVERLLLEPWPANVRSLMAALSEIAALDPEPGLRLWAVDEVLGKRAGHSAPLTRHSVEAALEACGGNETHAARRLGVSRGKLRRFLHR